MVTGLFHPVILEITEVTLTRGSLYKGKFVGINRLNSFCYLKNNQDISRHWHGREENFL